MLVKPQFLVRNDFLILDEADTIILLENAEEGHQIGNMLSGERRSPIISQYSEVQGGPPGGAGGGLGGLGVGMDESGEGNMSLLLNRESMPL